MPTIRLEQVSLRYKRGEKKGYAVHKGNVISDIDLTITQGEFIFLVGSRGAGKSTLLDVISGQTMPTEGRVLLNDSPVKRFGKSRAQLRSLFGIVPQEMRLVRDQTVRWNLMPKDTAVLAKERQEREALMKKALALVGLPGVEDRRLLEFGLSDCRRIELAKAIQNSPSVLVLDEVIGRIDADMGWDLLHLLIELNAHGTTIVVVTNAGRIINIMRKRVITLMGGKIISDEAKGRYDLFANRGWAR